MKSLLLILVTVTLASCAQECVTAADCDRGLCINGICNDDEVGLPIGSIKCTEDLDCPASGMCGKYGFCLYLLPLEGQESCFTSERCPSGHYCFKGVCYRKRENENAIVRECFSESDCSDGYLCRQGTCVRKLMPLDDVRYCPPINEMPEVPEECKTILMKDKRDCTIPFIACPSYWPLYQNLMDSYGPKRN